MRVYPHLTEKKKTPKKIHQDLETKPSSNSNILKAVKTFTLSSFALDQLVLASKEQNYVDFRIVNESDSL